MSRSDGSVIIDTDLDPKGFDAGSKELQSAIKSLNNKANALGPALQKAMSGGANAMSAFQGKAAAVEGTITELEGKLEQLGNSTIPTEDYAWLQKELEKARMESDKLAERQEKMSATGVSEQSRSWKNLQYDIDMANQKIRDYEAEMQQLEATGSAFQLGSDTPQFDALTAQLSSARSELEATRSQADQAQKSLGKMGKHRLSGLIGSLKKAASHMLDLHKNTSKASTGMAGGLLKNFFRLSMGIYTMRSLFTKLRSAITDGMNNLVQYSTSANSSLSSLKSSMTQLKNSIATAFSPILTMVEPALTRLINGLSKAITYVGMFFSAMSGAKVFTKAKAVQEDYAASLKKTEKNANKTNKALREQKKQLMGFDELNILQKDDNSDDSDDLGDIGDTALSPKDMFEEVAIPSSISDFVKRLKDAFAAGDYESVGKMIADKINGVFQMAKDAISWDALGDKITKGVNAICGIVNSLSHNIDFQLIGETIGTGITTILKTFDLLLTGLDWKSFGANFGQLVFGLIKGVDWGSLGSTLSHLLMVVPKTITGVLQGINWSEMAELLLNGLVSFIMGVDWAGLASTAFELLGSLFGAIIDFLIGLVETIWENACKWWRDVAFEDGEFTIAGLLDGIVNAMKNIGSWILNNIFLPFIKGFKSAFGIASPSRKMREQGLFIVDGLKNGLSERMPVVHEFFKTTCNKVKEIFGGFSWRSIGSNICDGIGNGINEGWTWLQNKASRVAKSLLDAAKSALGIHSPSRLFRDEVGKNIGYGIGEGISASESYILDTVTDVADAIATEFNNGEYSLGEVTASADYASVDSTLTDITDRIESSFLSLMDKLQAIADRVTFTVPATAYSVVPYANKTDTRPPEGKDDPSGDRGYIDELIDAVLQVGEAIVKAIDEKPTGGTIGDDAIFAAYNRHSDKISIVKG